MRIQLTWTSHIRTVADDNNIDDDDDNGDRCRRTARCEQVEWNNMEPVALLPLPVAQNQLENTHNGNG